MLIKLMILWLTVDDGGDDDDYDGLGDSDDGVPCDPWVRVADRDNLASRTTWRGTQHLIIILSIIIIAYIVRSLITSFTPFGRSGRMTHAKVQ